MTQNTAANLRDITPTLSTQENYLSAILDSKDFDQLIALKAELKDTWVKKQIFRTETEMRISVLNDGKFPTVAAKYWQCVREQNVFFENLMQLGFEYRKNDVEIKKLQRKLSQEADELECESIQIELEEKIYARANMELVARDRVREIEHWSRLKAELDDGTFDTQQVNTHQMTSLKLALQNRAQSLTAGSSQSEVINVMGPLSTVNRLEKERVQAQQNLELKQDPLSNLNQLNIDQIKLTTQLAADSSHD